jgi:CheY-like chemotaxis protein
MRERPLILLIDDEVFLEIASVKLLSDGFEVKITRSVSEALEKAEEFQADLVLSDIYMPPGPNGWEFALALRRNPKTKQIKIAFFSSLRDPAMEFPQSTRAIILSELKDIPIFSKMNDVEYWTNKLLPY